MSNSAWNSGLRQTILPLAIGSKFCMRRAMRKPGFPFTYMMVNCMPMHGCADFESNTIAKQVHFQSDAVTSDQWHHITFVYDEIVSDSEAVFSFYLDGIGDSANPTDGFKLSPTGSAYLGGLSADAFTRFHDGPSANQTYFLAGQITDYEFGTRHYLQTTLPALHMHNIHVTFHH